LCNNSLNLLMKSVKTLTILNAVSFIIHFSYTSGVFLTCFKMDEIINWNWLKIFVPFMIHYGLLFVTYIHSYIINPVEKSIILEDDNAIARDYFMKVVTRFGITIRLFKCSFNFWFLFTLADKLNDITKDTYWFTVSMPLWIKYGNCFFISL